MRDALVVDVSDIVGRPGAEQDFSGTHVVALHLGDTIIDGPMTVSGSVTGTVDGVIAVFTASATAKLTCVRCLTEWHDSVRTAGSQHFGETPDEDGYGIIERTIDLAGPATDELALSLPATPVCKPGCQGLCPTCGTDLNDDPCDGHGEGSTSPFAALKDLLDP